jgi:hypothetical protein
MRLLSLHIDTLCHPKRILRALLAHVTVRLIKGCNGHQYHRQPFGLAKVNG